MNKKLDNQGRLQIPFEIRERLKLEFGDKIEFEVKGNTIILKKLEVK